MTSPFSFDNYSMGTASDVSAAPAFTSPFSSPSGRVERRPSAAALASLPQGQPAGGSATSGNEGSPSAFSSLSSARSTDPEHAIPALVQRLQNADLARSEPPTNFTRRTSVSAEPYDPAARTYQAIVIPKSPSQRARIIAATSENILFKHLDEDQYRAIVDAMKEKTVASGTEVIKQGAEGDYFYVVEAGSFRAVLDGRTVCEYNGTGSFGELALMYNAPRAATVVATSDAVLWALDRFTFRRILLQHTLAKRRLYEASLSDVEILASLKKQELGKIADALEEATYEAGESVIRQGEMGTKFFIILDGNAAVSIRNPEGDGDKSLGTLSKGQYFGELALLNTAPRAATVRAEGRLRVASLDEEAFTRLLGPIRDILKTRAADY